MHEQEVFADVQKLRESLGPLPEPVARPVLVLVSGLPGSGKSYFSRRLAGELPSVIIESDAMRRLLFPSPSYGTQENRRLFTAMHRLIEDLLKKGISIIFDATNLLEQHREHIYRIAEKLDAGLIIVYVRAPEEVVRERLAHRMAHDTEEKSEADWAVYAHMRGRFERIRRNYIAVDTSRDLTPVIDRIVREARR